MKRGSIITLLVIFLYSTLCARTTIIMEQEGGVYKVPCVVNGLRMKFIFDTGAANVCISESMAQYMLENDYLSDSDILGTGQSSVADGRIVDHVKIRLNSLEIGGLKLNNVEAIVITGQTAPLLLGQSAITKMGTVSINGNTLIIEETGDCSQNNIEEWIKQADSYYDLSLYDKALSFYQKAYDCDGLSDFGIFIMGQCLSRLGYYNEALAIYEKLSKSIEKRQTTLKYEHWSGLYGEMAYCHYKLGNYQACISYDEKVLNYIPASNWKFEAETYYEMAMCYQQLNDYQRADAIALDGIRCILQNKYPSVYEEWRRKNFNDLSAVLSQYRWEYEEIMGNLIFLLCYDYFRISGEPHCRLTKIAAEMGSESAQNIRNSLRANGLCP